MRPHLRLPTTVSNLIRPRPSHFHPHQHSRSQTRPFTTLSSLHKQALPPRPTLPTTDLKHVYLKGSGPGGQKINKTSSAVQLTHLPTGIVVKSQATRSRSQNHTIARRILAEKIELIEKGSESRAARVVERKSKRKRSREKKARRKYRALEGKGIGEVGDGVGFGGLGAAAAAAGVSVMGGKAGRESLREVASDADEFEEDDDGDEDIHEGWDEDSELGEDHDHGDTLEEQLSELESTKEYTGIK